MSRRVVITGLGWVTPLGHDLESVWSALLEGRSGVSRTRYFDASTYPTTFSAQVGEDYRWADHVSDPALHAGVGRNIGFVLGAAGQAWKQAGLDALAADGRLDGERVGLYLGSGEGVLDFDNYTGTNLAAWDAEARAVDAVKWAAVGAERMSAEAEVAQEPNMPIAHLALEFDARGPAYNCLTACAASTQAIGEACEIIKRGNAEVMISGGAHTMIHPLGVTGFNRLTALSNRNDDIGRASRPFTADRDGFVMGEGAGIVILEEADHAAARGAAPLAEVAGYGSTADAYRITDIHPEGRGAAQAMRQALDQAGLTIDDIDYISAHGTGTKENDSIETRAVKAVFGERAKAVPMSSVKSMLGHLIAAAGAVELITCVLAQRDQVLPPTMNLDSPAPDCDLDYVANAPRPAGDKPYRACMSNNFGFGGQNDTLVIRAV